MSELLHALTPPRNTERTMAFFLKSPTTLSNFKRKAEFDEKRKPTPDAKRIRLHPLQTDLEQISLDTYLATLPTDSKPTFGVDFQPEVSMNKMMQR